MTLSYIIYSHIHIGVGNHFEVIQISMVVVIFEIEAMKFKFSCDALLKVW